jgi:hypothetical protein
VSDGKNERCSSDVRLDSGEIRNRGNLVLFFYVLIFLELKITSFLMVYETGANVPIHFKKTDLFLQNLKKMSYFDINLKKIL